MTIQAAIDRIDAMKPNMFSDVQKIKWLSEVDSYVWRELYKTHEGIPAGVDFVGYDQDTELDTQLLVPEPYTDVYDAYLSAQMDLKNAENGKYTQNMVRFNNAWQTYADYFNRTHMPVQIVRQFRF